MPSVPDFAWLALIAVLIFGTASFGAALCEKDEKIIQKILTDAKAKDWAAVLGLAAKNESSAQIRKAYMRTALALHLESFDSHVSDLKEKYGRSDLEGAFLETVRQTYTRAQRAMDEAYQKLLETNRGLETINPRTNDGRSIEITAMALQKALNLTSIEELVALGQENFAAFEKIEKIFLSKEQARFRLTTMVNDSDGFEPNRYRRIAGVFKSWLSHPDYDPSQFDFVWSYSLYLLKQVYQSTHRDYDLDARIFALAFKSPDLMLAFQKNVSVAIQSYDLKDRVKILEIAVLFAEKGHSEKGIQFIDDFISQKNTMESLREYPRIKSGVDRALSELKNVRHGYEWAERERNVRNWEAAWRSIANGARAQDLLEVVYSDPDRLEDHLLNANNPDLDVFFVGDNFDRTPEDTSVDFLKMSNEYLNHLLENHSFSRIGFEETLVDTYRKNPEVLHETLVGASLDKRIEYFNFVYRSGVPLGEANKNALVSYFRRYPTELGDYIAAPRQIQWVAPVFSTLQNEITHAAKWRRALKMPVEKRDYFLRKGGGSCLAVLIKMGMVKVPTPAPHRDSP